MASACTIKLSWAKIRLIFVPLSLCLYHFVLMDSFGERHFVTGDKFKPTQSRDWYVSHFNGTEGRDCGSQSLPCRSISTVVKRAKSGDWIYLDGTNTIKQPYTCEHVTSSQPSIYVNKSLSLKGIQSTAHIQCGNGRGLIFEGNRLNEISVLLSNIVFDTTYVRFQDSSVEIEDCSFLDILYAVNFTLHQQGTSSLTIRRSFFVNNHFCIKVNVEETLEPRGLRLSVKDSLFQDNLGRWNVNGSIGIWIDAPPMISVFANVTLTNTSFLSNHIGKSGMVGAFLENGKIRISSFNVSFLSNYGNYPTSSLYELWGREVTVIDSDSRYVNNTCRAVFVRGGDVHTHIRNVSYSHHRSDKSGGVLFVEKASFVDMHFENSSFLGNHVSQNGGAICIDDTNKNVSLTLKSVRFLKNSAGTYGGSIAIGSSSIMRASLGVDHLTTNFHDVHFNCSRFTTHGGSLYFNAMGKVSFMMSRTIFYMNIAGLEGGAISCAANEMEMNIQHSTISTNSCPAGGGAISVAVTQHFHLDASSTSFVSNSASNNGGAINIIKAGTVNLTFVDVQMVSNSAAGLGGGAIHFESVVSGYIVQILHSNFTNNVATQNYGGAISMRQGRNGQFLISDTVFDSNQCNSNGGSLYLDLEESTLDWSNVLFINSQSSGSGGSLYLDLEESTLDWSNVSFTKSQSSGSGGAVFLILTGSNDVYIRDSVFFSNRIRSFANTGGAMKILMSLDKLNSSNCLEKHNWSFDIEEQSSKGYRTWDYNNHIHFLDTRFQENTALSGGAIFLQNGETIFENCSFIDNFANFQGGSILSAGDSTSVLVYNTSFLQKSQIVGSVSGSVQEFIHSDSEGPLILTKNTVMVSKPFGDVNPMVMVTKGGYIQFDPFASFLVCPVGASLNKQNYSHTFNAEMCDSNQTTCTLKVTVLGLSCQICGPGLYSLQNGSAQGLNIDKNFKCLPCPDSGANCSRNIQAKPNFWGYETERNHTRLYFVPCPLHYCQPPNALDQSVYNGCQGNRSGWLCGACRRGYTATLFTTECRLNSECHDYWFWFVAGIYVSLMSLYLIAKPPIISWIFNYIFWFKDPEKDPHVSQETYDVISDDTHFDPGYLKIIFYFYQVADLLLVTTSAGGLLRNHFVLPIVGFFNFQQLFPGSGAGLVCPFVGLEFVSKQLFLSSEVFVIILFVGLMYLLRVLWCTVRKRQCPNSGPYLAAVMETLLLGYATFASTSFKLLHCVTVDSRRRLFFDANIVCYQWWQMLLILIVSSFFVPFIFLLAFGSVRLYNGEMSTNHFLLASIFPLYFLFFLSYKCACVVCRSVANNAAEPTDDQRQTVRQDPTTRMLCDPFRRPEAAQNGTLYWESVLIGRRFVLVVMHSLIADPSLRLTFLTITSVLILVHHMILRPFRDPKANALETSSLLALVVIATLNLMQASTETAGSRYTGGDAFAIVESILLGLLPFVAILVLVLGLVSLLVRMLYTLLKICFRVTEFDREEDKHSDGETSALLDPTA